MKQKYTTKSKNGLLYKMVFLPAFTVTLFWGIVSSQPAHAYLDPNTGSMILQMIVASIVGLGCTLSIWKEKISSLFKKGKKNENAKSE